jgi:hypothetical protein
MFEGVVAVSMPKAAEVRALAGDNAGSNLQISIAPWAAGPGMGGVPKAIEAVALTDVLAGDGEIQARRGFDTTPAIADAGRAAPIDGSTSSFQEYEMAERK